MTATHRYEAPVRELRFILHEVLEVERKLASLNLKDTPSRHDIGVLIRDLANFAEQHIAPLNALGDQEGCRFDDGQVYTPTGFKHAYDVYCASGLAAISLPREHGGRQLPAVISNLLTDILGSANHSWLMYNSISRGAYACIRANGSAAQQAAYLPALASGRWTGSMCITEAGAGTDVGLIQTHAQPTENGHYRLSGRKRMATNAEHDLTENILHLVLARIEGAPDGSKGLSLFVVPKFLSGTHGSLVRNAVHCEGLEDKMGIRGTPTCWMRFDGAAGELIGQPHQGLAAMFVMMNMARLGTGMQGINQGERALQLSRQHARTRLQGRAAMPRQRSTGRADPLMVHADVRRMLLTQKAWVEAGRAFAYWTAWQVDKSQSAPQAQDRHEASELVALLTPVLKAFCTDNGFACATLGQQVLGGLGYLKSSGASQFLADARVGQIYEGANGIQGADLLGRKVLPDHGRRLGLLLSKVLVTCDQTGDDTALEPMANCVRELARQLHMLTQELGPRCTAEPDTIGSAGYSYLRLLGHLMHAWFWLRMAILARQSPDAADGYYLAKLATARFYFSHMYPETRHLLAAARVDAEVVMGLAPDHF